MEKERKSWLAFFGSSKHTYYHIKHERDGYAYDWYSVVEVMNADWEKFMSMQQPRIQSFYSEFDWKGVDEPPIYVSAPYLSIWMMKASEDMITSFQQWSETLPEMGLEERLKTLLRIQSTSVDFVNSASWKLWNGLTSEMIFQRRAEFWVCSASISLFKTRSLSW